MTDDTIRKLAKVGFEAYGKSTGGVTWDGKPIPPWEAVGDKVQAAWMAATRAISESCTPGGGRDDHMP